MTIIVCCVHAKFQVDRQLTTEIKEVGGKYLRERVKTN